MLELISLFRVKLASRPLWLFVLLLVVSFAAGRMWRGRPGRSTIAARRTCIGLGVLAIVTYVALAIWYTSIDQYVDYAEPTIAAVGWLFYVGRPIYHAFDAAERYSHMYGPLAFMIPGWTLGMLGPGIVSSKIAGCAAGLLSIVLAHRLVRAAGAHRNALILTGLFAVLCLMYRHLSFWIRPDSFQLLFAFAGLLAATKTTRVGAVAGLAVAAGVIVNLRMTGPLYLLPAFALVAARFGTLAAVLAAFGAALIAVAPFLLFQNVSLENYLLWVGISAHNGLQFWTLRQNIEWALFLLVPLVPFLITRTPATLPARTLRWVVGGLAVGIAAVVVSASKPGAGSYHLMPFLPAVLYLIALCPEQVDVPSKQAAILRHGRTAFVLTVVLVAMCQQVYFLSGVAVDEGGRAAEDLRAFLGAGPKESIAVGYAEGMERLSLVRPLVVFHQNSYLIDAPAVQEYQMSGLELPAATIQAIAECRVRTWLIPREGAPFESINNYPNTGYRPLFPESFRQTFFANYEHAGRTRFYDVWRCRTTEVK